MAKKKTSVEPNSELPVVAPAEDLEPKHKTPHQEHMAEWESEKEKHDAGPKENLLANHPKFAKFKKYEGTNK